MFDDCVGRVHPAALSDNELPPGPPGAVTRRGYAAAMATEDASAPRPLAIVDIDGKLAMVVQTASSKVPLGRVRSVAGARDVHLVSETEFRDRFPDCEPGAMPPFGNLYGMEVFVLEDLTEDDEIAFNAGTHTELIRLKYRDFANLVHPTIV